MYYFNWIVDLIIPITMILLGSLYSRKAKSKISDISGFRTINSMASKESWKYSHKLASKILKIFGILLVIYVIVVKLLSNMDPENLSFINVGISLLVYILISVYINIKTKEFNKKNKN